jgi:tetratricopeptide (TPR) repeat protein
MYKKYPNIFIVAKRLKDIYIKTHKIEQATEILFSLFEKNYKQDKAKAREFLEEIVYIDSENKKANKYIEKFYGNTSSEQNEASKDVEIDFEEKTMVESKKIVDHDEIIETITIDEDSLSVDTHDDFDVEQIKFYISQGMYEQARLELDKKLKISPNNSMLLALLSELEQAIKPIIIDDTISENGEEIQEDIEDILRQFKKGVDESISKDDVKTRYDLGIAYKAMGLLDDAITEFKLVYKIGDNKGDCLLMIGLCHNDKGEFETAIKYFKKSLELSSNSNQKLAIYYEIGNAYELSGNLKHAFNIFKKISQKDKTFRDSYKRLKEIHVKLKVDTNNISYL